VPSIEQRLRELEERLAALEASRGPRSPECRKGHDPKTCFSASTYQYQQGCGGAACTAVNTAYYSPAAKAARKAAKEVPVNKPKKKGGWGGASNKG
jgi:hypothetical protein